MSPTDGDCQQCGTYTEGTLCSRCVANLVKVLGELPALLRELEVVCVRQDHVQSAVSTRPLKRRPDVAAVEYTAIPPRLRSSQGRIALPSTPWGYNPDASAILQAARQDLVLWMRNLIAAGARDAPAAVLEPIEGPWHGSFLRVNEMANPRHQPAPTSCGHASCVSIMRSRSTLPARRLGPCAWLVEHRADVAQYELAGELAGNLTYWRNRIAAMIDRHGPNDVFLGVCDAVMVICGEQLYARAGDRDVECPRCGWLYSVARRKDRLLARVYDEVRTIRDVADAVTGLLTDDRDEAVECTPSMIRNYVTRGRLAYRGADAEGRQLVKVSDVVKLLRDKLERDKLRRSKPRKVSA